MNWLFTENADHSSLMIFAFLLANMISGIILMITTFMLIYFLRKKVLGISDPVLAVVTLAIFLLGIKKLITISILKWAAYPSVCTLVDIGIAITLLILMCFLPALILRLLVVVTRDEDLLLRLIEETRCKITAEDLARSLEIRNSVLQAIIFKFDTILNIQHRSGNLSETVTSLRNVISSSGVPDCGD